MLYKTNNNATIQALVAIINHEGIIKQYATMKEQHTPPLQYSRGYAKEMECIEMKAYDYGGTASQHYKYVNAVINEDTGTVLDLKKLLKDPKYTDT